MKSRFNTIQISGQVSHDKNPIRFKILSLPRDKPLSIKQTSGQENNISLKSSALKKKSLDRKKKMLTSIGTAEKKVSTRREYCPVIKCFHKDKKNNIISKLVNCKYSKNEVESQKGKLDEKKYLQLLSDYNLQFPSYLSQDIKKTMMKKSSPDLLRNYLMREKEKRKHMRVSQSEIVRIVNLGQRKLNMYFQTTFGIQSHFHMLKTVYAQKEEEKKDHLEYLSEKIIFNSLPQIPDKEQLDSFINDYINGRKQTNLQSLTKLSNFYIEYTSEELYFGQIKNGKKDGFGVMLTQKFCFEGYFQEGYKTKGQQKNEKGTYRGQFKFNQKSGFGSFEFTDGSFYSGQMKNNMKDGTGSYSHPKGIYYTGEWKKDQFHGYGTLKNEDSQYKGSFVEGLKEGWGRQAMKNGDIYQGIFCRNIPHDKGVYTWKNGTQYEGKFFRGFRTGQGHLSTLDGCVYNGDFIDEEPSGLCEIIVPEISIYRGYFKDGKKNGKGILKLMKIEKVFQGFWQNDILLNTIQS